MIDLLIPSHHLERPNKDDLRKVALTARKKSGKKASPPAEIIDGLGLLVCLVIHFAGMKDRNGAPDALNTILKRWPWLRHIFDGREFTGSKRKSRQQKIRQFMLEIIKRSDQAEGFKLLPRKWIVKHTPP